MRARLRAVVNGGGGAVLLVLGACGSPPVDEPASEPAKPVVPVAGIVAGSLSYPSDYLPEDMQVCARNVATGEQFCDAEKRGSAYRLVVAAGSYTVWSQTADEPGRQAFYTAFVTCGLKAGCVDHSPITIDVAAGQTVDGIDPGDWYTD